MRLLIFASCRDCLSYLASAETVLDLLLPAETTVHKNWLPAETVHVILLPAETLSRDCRQSRQKPNMMESLCRKRKLADLFIPCDICIEGNACIGFG